MIHRWGFGPEVLCLHCSLARGRAFAGLAKHLGGHMLLAPDLPGHGAAADADPDRDLHDQATELALAALPIGPVIGHSFGATVALRLAIEAPERVTALVLYEPVLFAAAGDGPGRRETAQRDDITVLLAAGEHGAALDRFLAVWGGGAPLKPEQRAYMEARIPLIAAASPALNEDAAGILPRLRRITVPVLLMEGAESPTVIPEINAALAQALPDARRVQVSGAGHMGPVTHTSEVAAEIAGFF